MSASANTEYPEIATFIRENDDNPLELGGTLFSDKAIEFPYSIHTNMRKYVFIYIYISIYLSVCMYLTIFQ